MVADASETERAPPKTLDPVRSSGAPGEAASRPSGVGKERLLPVPLPEMSRPATGRRRAGRGLPLGILLYLVSIGAIAATTVGVFFGIGFSLLVQPSGAMISIVGERDRGSVTKPLLYGLVPDFFGNGSATEGKAAPPAIEPGIAHTIATAALPAVPLVRSSEPDQGPMPAKSDAPPPPMGDAPAGVAKDASSGDQEQRTEARNASPAAPQPEPAPWSTASTAMAAPSGPSVSAVEIGQLLARGDAFLRIGDVTSARLFYERAADSGNGQAAMRMGATFDPAFLGRAGLNGTHGDPARAQSWYRHALDLSAAEADRHSDGRQTK